jgi:hypothetical protein
MARSTPQGDGASPSPLAPEAQAAAPAPAQPKPSDIEQCVADWFRHHFHDSPVSRDTEVFNTVQAARTDLVSRLGKLIGG